MTVVRVLYTVQGIWNVLHYDAIWKALESYRSYYGIWQNMAEHRPELDGNIQNLLETTRIVQTMGSVDPYSYPCRHTRPHDLWCRR